MNSNSCNLIPLTASRTVNFFTCPQLRFTPCRGKESSQWICHAKPLISQELAPSPWARVCFMHNRAELTALSNEAEFMDLVYVRCPKSHMLMILHSME